MIDRTGVSWITTSVTLHEIYWYGWKLHQNEGRRGDERNDPITRNRSSQCHRRSPTVSPPHSIVGNMSFSKNLFFHSDWPMHDLLDYNISNGVVKLNCHVCQINRKIFKMSAPEDSIVCKINLLLKHSLRSPASHCTSTTAELGVWDSGLLSQAVFRPTQEQELWTDHRSFGLRPRGSQDNHIMHSHSWEKLGQL